MNLNCLLLNSQDTISLCIPIKSQSCMTFVIGSADCVYRVILEIPHYNYLKEINNPDASVGVCCSHKVVAVGFNTR